MPVTARLSRRFYETFGDEIANELVGWFNAVDDAYRSEFRELFEVHFARFDAKLEQRVAGLEAKLEQRVAELRAETGLRIGQVESRIGQLEAKVEQRLAEVRAGLVRWMFAFWAGSVAATVGIVAGAVVILRR